MNCLGVYKALDSFLLIFTGFEIEIIQSSNSLEVYSVFHQENMSFQKLIERHKAN